MAAATSEGSSIPEHDIGQVDDGAEGDAVAFAGGATLAPHLVEEGSGLLNCIWSRPKDGWTVIPSWRSEDRNTTKLPTGTPGVGLAPRANSRVPVYLYRCR